MHDDNGLFACGKGQPTKEATRIRLECPKHEDDLKSMREDSLMNDKSQMLVMLLMATDKMI